MPCGKDQELEVGDYEYDFDSYESAVEYFLRIKPLLVADLGAPAIDFTSQESKTRLRQFGPQAEELSRYSVLWGFRRYSVSIGVIKLESTSSRTKVIIRYASRGS